MDADYYLDTIKTVFQEFKLVKGTWEVMSVEGKLERVMPSDIKTTAVMTVEGELDDISGSGQTRAALDMCSGVPASHKKHLEAMGAGHYGIFSGRRWRDVVYPAVKAFILEENKSLMPAETVPVAVKKTAPVAKAPKAPKATPVIAQTALPKAPTPAAKPAAKRGSKPVLVAVKQAEAPPAAPVAITEKVAPAVVASPVAAVTAELAPSPEITATPIPPEQSAA